MDAGRRAALEVIASLRGHYDEIEHKAQIAFAIYGPVGFFAMTGSPYAKYMEALQKAYKLCDKADEELKGFTPPDK